MPRLSPFLAWVASLPPGAVLPLSRRAVLAALAAHADAGRDDPVVAELAMLAGCTPRSVERHVAGLADASQGGPFIAIEPRRAAEGWRRNRYRLLAPLNVLEAAEAHAMAVSIIASDGLIVGAEPVSARRQIAPPPDIVSGGPPDNSARHPTQSRQASRQYGAPPDTVSGRAYEEHGGARARPIPIPSHPDFLAFAFSTHETREKAALVLGVCGPGLVPFGADTAGELLNSLAHLLDGAWAQFDFHRDVLPTVMRKTRKPREPGKQLRDFWLLTDNIVEAVELRQARMRAGRARASGGGRGGSRQVASKGTAREARPAAERSRSDELDRMLGRFRRHGEGDADGGR